MRDVDCLLPRPSYAVARGRPTTASPMPHPPEFVVLPCRLFHRHWLAGVLVAASLQLVAAEPPPLFLRACAPCHGKDGKAGTPAGRQLGVKDMSQSKLTEAQIRDQILDGKKGPDGSSKMPSFRQTLKPEDIDALARFAKSLQPPR